MGPVSDSAPQSRPLPPHLAAVAGLLMGGADAIPGVSGGTIALILGIYERFIGALDTVVRSPALVRNAEGRRRLGRALALLVPLGAGVVVAYYLATKLLVGAAEEPGVIRRPETAPIAFAFFFGLVFASVREPWRRIRSRQPAHWMAGALGLVVAAAFAYLPHARSEPETWMLLFGGAGAISVMLLPGVSGSLFLVIIGQYTAVAGAVHDRAFGTLAVFLAGIALGVAAFIPLLRTLLARAHDTTMAVLTGLMAGSLVALWPFKDNYESKAGPMNNIAPASDAGLLAAAGLAAVAGAAVVLLLNRLERRLSPEA